MAEQSYGTLGDWLLCLALLILLELPRMPRNPEGHSPKYWRRHPKPQPEKESATPPNQIPNKASSEQKFYDSTLFWGLVGVCLALVLAGVGLVLNGLPNIGIGFFWGALPFGAMAIWCFVNGVTKRTGWRIAGRVVGVILLGLVDLRVMLWFSPKDINHGTRFVAQLIPAFNTNDGKSADQASLVLENKDTVLDQHVYMFFATPTAISKIEIDNPERIHLVSGGPQQLGIFSSNRELELSATELAPGEIRSVLVYFGKTEQGDFKVGLRSEKCPDPCKNVGVIGPYKISFDIVKPPK